MRGGRNANPEFLSSVIYRFHRRRTKGLLIFDKIYVKICSYKKPCSAFDGCISKKHLTECHALHKTKFMPAGMSSFLYPIPKGLQETPAVGSERIGRVILSMKYMHTPEEQRNRIIQGTRHLVALGGMRNFSFPKLMDEIGINASAVYALYKNKANPLTSCYLEIDNEIAHLLERALRQSPPHRDQAEAIDDSC